MIYRENCNILSDNLQQFSNKNTGVRFTFGADTTIDPDNIQYGTVICSPNDPDIIPLKSDPQYKIDGLKLNRNELIKYCAQNARQARPLRVRLTPTNREHVNARAPRRTHKKATGSGKGGGDSGDGEPGQLYLNKKKSPRCYQQQRDERSRNHLDRARFLVEAMFFLVKIQWLNITTLHILPQVVTRYFVRVRSSWFLTFTTGDNPTRSNGGGDVL